MIVALIPARSGSKRVKNKNIRPLGGYPLMAWSIACAHILGLHPVVSTDSHRYTDIARAYSASAIWRERELPLDTDVMQHFRQIHLPICENKMIVYLRPTTPLRDPAVVQEAIDQFKMNNLASSLRSGYKMSESAYKSALQHRDEWVAPFGLVPNEYMPVTYQLDGYVDITRNNDFQHPMTFITPNVGEIDEEEDFEYIEWRLQKYGSVIYDYLKRNYQNPQTI